MEHKPHHDSATQLPFPHGFARQSPCFSEHSLYETIEQSASFLPVFQSSYREETLLFYIIQESPLLTQFLRPIDHFVCGRGVTLSQRQDTLP
jgi:hypothetical protein